MESSHRHLKKAIEQALLLRGSVDFESTDAYMRLVNQQVALPNAGRSERFAEEQQVMKSLNVRRLDAFSKETARVSRGSLIRVQGNQSINGPRYLFLVYTAWYGLLVHDRCAFGQPPCWLTHPAKSRFRRRLPELLPCRCTPGILREQAARQIIRVKRIIRRESKAISSICVWLILHCSTELDLWI